MPQNRVSDTITHVTLNTINNAMLCAISYCDVDFGVVIASQLALHYILYLVSLTSWSYTMLCLFIINIFLATKQKMFMFYNAQTTNLIFVGKK